MKNIFPVLRASPLFTGIDGGDFDRMMACLGAYARQCGKGETVCFEGDTVTDIGLLTNGRLHLVKDDIWGNRSIVTEITPPEMFAESVVCSGIGRIPVSVVAREDCEILFIDYRKMFTACSTACVFHSKLIRNMIGVLARKNVLMSAKIEHITKRTIKEKLLSYMMEQARKNSSAAFDIPFNRQELADYLSVERSALSAELSKLKADGIIAYRKNHFELHNYG
ncbi:MAG: Crp/Fnr family transcriptional regulator [Desulfovibrio sp.]|jgi:CRP-like cAMP-binding protein|nr:Crp/Fnr family transcriptional regulator [Desulfovibrio sp.]